MINAKRRVADILNIWAEKYGHRMVQPNTTVEVPEIHNHLRNALQCIAEQPDVVQIGLPFSAEMYLKTHWQLILR